MVSYCALFDADPAYRSNCKAAISGSFAGVWTPSMAADGSWPTLYYATSSWDTPGGASLVNGSISVVGNGTAWTAASFPCTVWFTNDPSGWPADNTAGDATTYTATFVDATHLNLDRPYQGSSGPHGWALASGGGMIGWGAQPASMGILGAAFDLAAKAIADTDPTNSALASSYNLATANWIVAYGYWPLQRGLYAVAQGVNCQAPISDNNTACTGGNSREQARALSADALRGIMVTYAFTQRTDLRAFADALYNAMFAKPGSCPSGSLVCVPDGYYLSGLDDGGSMMTAAPPQGNEWFGEFFGVNGSSKWPAYRVGGPASGGTRTLYVNFDAGSVVGAAKVRVTATEPSGRALQTECSSSPCAVVFDGGQGTPLIELSYLSDAGVVLAKTTIPL
jgi:hypothetical protein